MSYVDPASAGTPAPGKPIPSAWALDVQTDIELLHPAAANAGTQYVTAAGSDANDGLTWGSAKASLSAAISALPANGGTVEVGYGSVSASNATPTAGVTIIGRGRGATILLFATDTGTSTYGLDCSASSPEFPITLERMEVRGPGFGSFTIGTAPANMSGIKTGGKAILRDLYVQGFYAGIEIASDHEYFENVKSSNNFYNIYETGANASYGNQSFVHCDFTGATRASVAVSGSGMLDSTSWAEADLGFAPFGLYKEAHTTGNPQLLSNSWCDMFFEACGNASIYDSNTTVNTLLNTTFLRPTFNSGNGTYHDAGQPQTASVNISGGNFTVIGDDSTPLSGGYLYSSTNACFLVTDKTPAATDYASATWLGSVHRKVGGVGSSMNILQESTVCQAGAAVTAGQVVQLQGTTTVKPFASDNSHSYLGVAAYTASSNGPVAVVIKGMASTLCSEHVTLQGVRLEIDPVTPSQVRAVNLDLGTNFAATTQTPSVYPVIGISSNSNSGTNTTLPMYLTGTYIDPSYCSPAQVSALPGASSSFRGQMLILQGNGSTTADTLNICLLSASNTYSWKQIVSG